MAAPSRPRTVAAVLERYPRSYAEELGVRSPGTPSGLFRVLAMALLMGARIRADTAFEAARALARHRWTSPRALADAGWAERARVLNRSGYARYDERTSTMLGETADLVLDRYRGDLRRLRKAADRDPAAERRLVMEFPGIGPTSADIFFREVQGAWPELYPFADRRVLAVARTLGLGSDARTVARAVDRPDVVRLVDGLVRTGLDRAEADVRRAASGR
jgi:endonuclease III